MSNKHGLEELRVLVKRCFELYFRRVVVKFYVCVPQIDTLQILNYILPKYTWVSLHLHASLMFLIKLDLTIETTEEVYLLKRAVNVSSQLRFLPRIWLLFIIFT